MDPRRPAIEAPRRRGQGRRLGHRRRSRPGNAHRDRRRISLDHRQQILPPRPRQRQADPDRRPCEDHLLRRRRIRPRRHIVGDLGRGQRRPAARPARPRHRPLHAGRPRRRAGTSTVSPSPRTAAPSPSSPTRRASTACRCSTSPAAASAASPGIPAGTIGGLEFAPWGTLGLSLNSAKSPTDAYSLDPATLKLTRWTRARPAASTPTSTSSPNWSR